MLLIIRRPRYARDDAEDGAQSVIHAVDRIGNPTAAAAMPAFAFEDRVEERARAGRSSGRHRVEDASVRLLLERRFAKKLLRVRIACQRALALGAVTGLVPVFRRFHPANGDVEPGHAVPPAAE